MPLQIVITANGARCTGLAGRTLGDFLREHGVVPARVRIVHNGHPLASCQADHLPLRNGDRIDYAPRVADA